MALWLRQSTALPRGLVLNHSTGGCFHSMQIEVKYSVLSGDITPATLCLFSQNIVHKYADLGMGFFGGWGKIF